MKTTRILALLLATLLCALSLFAVSCEKPEETPDAQSSTESTVETENGSETETVTDTESLTGLWANATYKTDVTVGEGEKTITLTVLAENTSIVITVKTDADTVGEALLENGLIAGEEGAYGLYVKAVNAITADYDVDGYYWAFYEGEDYAMTGVDSTALVDGGAYSLKREK